MPRAATTTERRAITTVIGDRLSKRLAQRRTSMAHSRAVRALPLPTAQRLVLLEQRQFAAAIPVTVRSWTGTVMGLDVSEKRCLIALAACLPIAALSSCTPTQADSDGALSEAIRQSGQTRQLELRIDGLTLESKILSERLDRLEEAAKAAKPAADPGAPFVLWEASVQIWPQVLGGYRPDKPLSSYSASRDCEAAVEEFVKGQENHSDDLRSYLLTQGTTVTKISYACLPSGVDPRIRR